VALAVGDLADRLTPATLLGDVQRVWEAAAGPALAPRATPTAARDGVVTLTCESAVWAQELTLMQAALVDALNAALGDVRVTGIRCSAAPPGAWARGG
jgi:predicted nucleic acid-binding Zn ribbon protein